MICTQCNHVFKGRADARYCSAKCRKAANRDKVKCDDVTDKPKCDKTPDVIPKIQNTPEFSIPNFGQPGCECRHCKNNRHNGSRLVINHGPHKPASELKSGEVNRVSLPGDVDSVGTEGMSRRASWEDSPTPEPEGAKAWHCC